MAEARIPEFFGETQIRVQVLDFMGLGSCMPREAWRLPSPQMLHHHSVTEPGGELLLGLPTLLTTHHVDAEDDSSAKQP